MGGRFMPMRSFAYRQDSEIIVCAWVNDDRSKRAYGSTTPTQFLARCWLLVNHWITGKIFSLLWKTKLIDHLPTILHWMAGRNAKSP
jgi:hypothetical protein